MSLKHGLLGFLNYNSMTGYELDKVFKESLNFFWQAQASQIYRELGTMEKKGWLTSEKIIQDDKPNKKLYTLTASGREELKDWLSKIDRQEGISCKNSFLIKIFFSGEKSLPDNIEVLKEFIVTCENELQKMTKTDDSITSHKEEIDDEEKAVCWEISASYGFYYYKMSIQWANDAINRLEEINEYTST